MIVFDDEVSQKVFLETGSFTGYRPLRELGLGYLSATRHFKQPLCGNEEGWGPLSPFRYDFTQCFIDVWVASVAVFGIVFGSIALWWILAKRNPSGLAKDRQFWIKEVCITLLLGARMDGSYKVSDADMAPADTSCHYHCRLRRAASYTDHQLSRRVVWRLPSVDDGRHYRIPAGRLLHPMGRVLPAAEPDRGRAFLLALPPDRPRRPAAIPRLAAALRIQPPIILNLLGRLWLGSGRVLRGMAVA